jgi:hypothetical protein
MFAEKKQRSFSISNIRSFAPHLTLHKVTLRTAPLVYDPTDRMNLLYPPDTKAFLYYTTPPGRPRIAGELRLRVVSNDNPASFASGSDLLRTNGQPWSRPLHVLPRYYSVVYEKLREERLVPDDLHAALMNLSKTHSRYSRSQFLFTLHDTFIIDFFKITQVLRVVTEKGTETLPFMKSFSEKREPSRSRRRPYKGT